MHQRQVVTWPGVHRQGYAAKRVLLGNGRSQPVIQGTAAAHGVHNEAGGRAAQGVQLVWCRAREALALDQRGNINHVGPLHMG